MRAKKATIRKYVVWLSLTLAAIVLLMFMYFRYVQQDYRSEREAAVSKALEQNELVRVSKAERYVWDQTYWIVYGENESGEPVIVWVGDDEIYSKKAADGIDRAELARTIENQPGVNLLRLTPGVFGGQLVWEAYYNKKEEDINRPYYAFYRFADGALLAVFPQPVR
jgi:uncharacterized protein YpmB